MASLSFDKNQSFLGNSAASTAPVNTQGSGLFTNIGNSLGMTPGHSFGGKQTFPSDPVSNAGAAMVNPLASGGTTFNPALAGAFSKPAVKPVAQTQKSGSINDFIDTSHQTSQGGTITSTGGNPTGWTTPSGFKLDASGSVPSDALSNSSSTSDLASTHKGLEDYVNGLAQAHGYSPQFTQALEQKYQAQSQAAMLGITSAGYGAKSASINADLARGTGYTGMSLDQGQTRAGQLQAFNSEGLSQNQIAQALNTQQATQAGIDLNTQELSRTGNIAAAQTQIQYNPIAITALNALSQADSLQKEYLDAGILPFEQTGLSPVQYQQYAMQKASQAPSFQAKYQQTYQLPGGGLETYNKLDPTAPGHTLVSGSDAASGSADAASLHTQQAYLDQTTRSLANADNGFNQILSTFKSKKINDSDIPIVNLAANRAKYNLGNTDLLAFQAGLQEVANEYQQVFSRGGSVTDEVRNTTKNILDGNISMKGLQKVHNELKAQGGIVISGAQAQINQTKSRLGGGSASSIQANPNGTLRAVSF